MPAGVLARAATTVVVALAIMMLAFAGQAFAQAVPPNPAPVETYYLPITDQQALVMLKGINNAATPNVYTYASMAIGTQGTIVYYDHWENGYITSIANPSDGQIYGPGQLDGVQIWGNGKCSDGFPNNKDGIWTNGPTCPNDAWDVFDSGDVVVLRGSKSQAELDNDAARLDFDGRDKFAATEQISVARTYWADGAATLLAGAVEVYPTSDWGLEYVAPAGVNDTFNSQFTAATLVIMATENDTALSITGQGTGSTISCSDGATNLNDLDQGESCIVTNVNRGAKVLNSTSTKPVQVHMFTGEVGSQYESRAFTLLPTSQWGPSYYSPVGTRSNNPAQIIVYNPGQTTNGGTLYVRCAWEGTAFSDFTVNSGAAGAVDVPAGSGAHCFAKTASGNATLLSSAKFFAISPVDREGASWDWGFTLIPDSLLAPQALVGLGLGQDPEASLSDNGSPVWVSAFCPAGTNSTYIYADITGDGQADHVDLDGNLIWGNGDEDTRESASPNGILVNVRESVRIYSPNVPNQSNGTPQNQTGMRVWTLSGANGTGTPVCNLAVAWGEDPGFISSGSPGFDVGTTVRPLRSFTVNKTIGLATDTNGDGSITPGDEVTYTIDIKNTGLAPIFAINVRDELPLPQVDYVPLSTKFAIVSGAGTVGPRSPIPDGGGSTAFPLDTPGYNWFGSLAGSQFYKNPPVLGETLQVTFRATIKAKPAVQCGDTIKNVAFATVGGQTRTDEEVTPIDCPSTIEIIKQANGGTKTFSFTTTKSPNTPALESAYQSFDLTPVINDSASKLMTPLTPDRTYVVTEADPGVGWRLSDLSCTVSPAGTSAAPSIDQTNRKVTIVLGQESTVRCTFTNEKPQVRIRLTPTTAENAVNVAHTFTAFVEGSTDNGASWSGISGVPVNFTKTGAGTLASTSCNTAGTAGSCSVVLNSGAAGVTTVNATAPSVTYRTFTFTNVTTVGGTGQSGPATKTWTDLRISISPLTDDNKVGDAHEFTVLVEKKVATPQTGLRCRVQTQPSATPAQHRAQRQRPAQRLPAATVSANSQSTRR